MAKPERKGIDKVFILLGIAAIVMLLIAGSMAWYGYKFATNSVQTELSGQKIYFPEKGSPSFDPTEFPELQKYAGQLVNDGPKAKAYANGFIGRHLDKVASGKTYSEVSTEAINDPTNTKLQQQKQTLFEGEALRGLLLGDGYAYWTFGILAMYASIASFAGAIVMGILVLLGLRHLARLN
jgi:hypothetical protein